MDVHKTEEVTMMLREWTTVKFQIESLQVKGNTLKRSHEKRRRNDTGKNARKILRMRK